MNAYVQQKASAKLIASMPLSSPLPITLWAWTGAAILLFQIYVLGSWILGPHFVPTPPGADPLPPMQHFYNLLLQAGVTGVAVLCLIKWLILPWVREGRMSADGRLFTTGAMIFFWDMTMNYTSTALFYNSHFVNFGAWSLGSWPGWMSPAGNLLPEPIFVTLPGYTSLVTTQAIFVCWLMRKAKTRWPQLGVLSLLGLIVLGCTVADTVIEVLMLRTGVYAYPGSVSSLTLFAGKTYQFPLYEGFLFGGLGVGAMTTLHFFRDDKGQTLAERGSEKLKIGASGKQWMRSLAVYGFCHLCFFVLYAVPMQWFSLHSDPFPAGYPSYMTNGMCVYGVDGNQCPGPGVMMPRL